MIKGLISHSWDHPCSSSQKLFRFIKTVPSYGVQITFASQDAKKTGTNTDITPSTQPISNHKGTGSHILGGLRGAPTALDKKFLVWSGTFKSADEIPRQLNADVIHRARSWGRIRTNIAFLFLAAAGGGVMVFLGKRAAARGENIEKQNLEWHRKNKEQYESEQGRKIK